MFNSKKVLSVFHLALLPSSVPSDAFRCISSCVFVFCHAQQCHWSTGGTVDDLRAGRCDAGRRHAHLAAVLRGRGHLRRSVGVGPARDPDHGQRPHSNHSLQVRWRHAHTHTTPTHNYSLHPNSRTHNNSLHLSLTPVTYTIR